MFKDPKDGLFRYDDVVSNKGFLAPCVGCKYFRSFRYYPPKVEKQYLTETGERYRIW